MTETSMVATIMVPTHKTSDCRLKMQRNHFHTMILIYPESLIIVINFEKIIFWTLLTWFAYTYATILLDIWSNNEVTHSQVAIKGSRKWGNPDLSYE